MNPPVLAHDWYPVPVPTNVEIGDGSWLYSTFAFLHYRSRRPVGVRIGRHSGVYIDTLFDLGPDGEVVIGDHCTLAGPIVATAGRVVIGDRVLISSRVVIADRHAPVPARAEPPGAGPAAAEAAEAESAGVPTVVEIGDDAWIGTGAILLAGARIGVGAIVGAGSVVAEAVPAGAVAAGDPLRIVGRSEPSGLAER